MNVLLREYVPLEVHYLPCIFAIYGRLWFRGKTREKVFFSFRDFAGVLSAMISQEFDFNERGCEKEGRESPLMNGQWQWNMREESEEECSKAKLWWFLSKMIYSTHFDDAGAEWTLHNKKRHKVMCINWASSTHSNDETIIFPEFKSILVLLLLNFVWAWPTFFRECSCVREIIRPIKLYSVLSSSYHQTVFSLGGKIAHAKN